MSTPEPQLDLAEQTENAQTGRIALRSARWHEARIALTRAVEIADARGDPAPDVHDDLGIALWWLNEIEGSHHQRRLAFLGFQEQGEWGRAAVIACWLAREQIFLLGSFPAMQGWFARADRLLEQMDAEPAPNAHRAWCAILRASLLASHADMVTIAPQIVADARTLRLPALEAFALAFYGQALVGVGRVGEGMRALDEAMTMSTSGEIADYAVASEVFCVMLSACESAGDWVRSEHWCNIATAFAHRYQCPFLAAYCRTAYGGLLTALGRWQEAERALNEAIEAFRVGHKGLRVHAQVKLAELRLLQGRRTDAEHLLAGLEDQGSAQLVLARMYMLRGENTLARALLERTLGDVTHATLQHLPALLLLLEVTSSSDDAQPSALIDTIEAVARQGDSPLLRAQVACALGRAALQRNDFSVARAHFDDALANLQHYDQSLLAGRVRLLMAQTLQSSDRAGAQAWALGALATFERIGAVREVDECWALLRTLEVSGGVRRPSTYTSPLSAREGEIAALVAQGLSNREIGERLFISAKTVEHHVGSILSKLNLRSRTEIATFAASGKLKLPSA